jgi:DNA-binding CsgD family transcriptional regulator
VTRPWTPTPGQPLTDRQHEFLRRTADGESWRQIGAAMELTVNGVGSLSRQVLRKLDARSAAHAVRIGYETGLLGRPRKKPTARQLQMLTLAAAGHNSPQIGALLGVTKYAVKGALKETYRRLGATDRASAIEVARQAGLIPATLRSAA